MDVDDRIARLHAELAHAEAEFTRGRAGAYQDLYSHGDDVSIFGAFGGSEHGWDLVGPRLAWAAAQFQPHEPFERIPVSETFGADVGCQVWLTRGTAKTVNGGAMSELRLTHVYRLEGDRWRIVHRHADALVTRAIPT